MIDIKIENSTLKRLESLAVGFDTPDAVINRLIDGAEGRPDIKPTIVFNPSLESDFKEKLLEEKIAEVCIYSGDTSPVISIWNATKLTRTSNLKANLWSGLLRNWKSKGITKVELTVLDRNVDGQLLDLAHALGLTYQDALIVKPKYHRENADTFLIYFENEEMSILNKISHKLNIDLEVYLPSYMLDLA